MTAQTLTRPRPHQPRPNPGSGSVIGGVDTHADTHFGAVLDCVGRLLGTRQFPADGQGYRQLLAWMRSFGDLDRVGVEGTSSYGAGLTRHLRAAGIHVIEVNRPNRRARRLHGKSDPLDAENAARRALSGEEDIAPKDTTTALESIRVLRIARTGAIKARTAAFNQLKDLLITAPDPVRDRWRGKTLHRVSLEAARLRPDINQASDPSTATRLALRSIGQRILALNEEIAALDKQLVGLVARTAPTTVALTGVGTETAAQLLLTAGANIERLHNEASFAALCAASPIPASSGKTNRHRLNPAGDREANKALYIIAVVSMRYCTKTKAYVERRQTEGLTKKEAIRALKRYIARDLYHAIRADLTQPLSPLDDL